MSAARGSRRRRGPQVCALTGLTYRQLDYWARTGLLTPSIAEARGSGTQRRYSAGDVRRAFVAKRLLDLGISLQSVRLALPLVEEGARGYLVVGVDRAQLCGPNDLVDTIASSPVRVVVDLDAMPAPDATTAGAA